MFGVSGITLTRPKISIDGVPSKVFYLDDQNHLVFKDKNMSIYPVENKNVKGWKCYSYICDPMQFRGQFQQKKAKLIKGLIPKLHYKLLTDGHSVTLEDGTVVTPDQVVDPPMPS